MGTFTVSIQELMDEDFDFGLDAYPIFDEGYRAGLNAKILDHYRNYEIGHETEERFKFALRRRMNEIMPFYNKVYQSEQIEFDPLQTIDFTELTDSESSGSTSSDTNTTNMNSAKSRSRAVNSDTPQVRLSPDEDYATGAVDTASDSSAEGEGSATATGTETANGNVNRRMTGSQGHAAQLLIQYRASLLNIDLMIIGELANLFMGVWNTTDSYTNSGRFYHGFGYFTV